MRGACGRGPACGNPGAHGFSEILYAFSSGSNNNGSAFGGLTVSGFFYATAIGICMLIGALLADGARARDRRFTRQKEARAAETCRHAADPHAAVRRASWSATVDPGGRARRLIPSLALGPVVEHLMLVCAARGHAPGG